MARFARNRGSRKMWLRSSTTTTQATGTVNILDLMSGWRAEGLPFSDATVLRTQGSIMASHAGLVGAGLRLTCGLIIGNRDDVAVTNVDPFADPFADWWWFDFLYAAATAEGFRVRELFDIRSMRKIKSREETMYFIADNGSGEAITWNWACSVLLLLP